MADLSVPHKDPGSQALQLVALAIVSLIAILAAGLLMGVVSAMLQRGSLPSGIGAGIVAGMLIAFAASSWGAWRLSAPWRQPGRSQYQRRYTRAWIAMIGAGLVLGILIGVTNDADGGVGALFSNEPLRPATALGLAAAVASTLGASILVYHRAIDDHEQQAYLWANSLAFYFLAIAIPAAWLLARGGLIPAIGIGTTMLILLASLVINLVAWAFLKFR